LLKSCRNVERQCSSAHCHQHRWKPPPMNSEVLKHPLSSLHLTPSVTCLVHSKIFWEAAI
jgi:hypothetical protein